MRRSKYADYKVGDVFEGFTILQLLGRTSSGHFEAVFECKCGEPFTRTFSNLVRNTTHGCRTCSKRFVAESKRKFKVKNRGMYRIWKGINHRCYNETDPAFKWYGGKGVKVCERWRDTSHQGFNNFYDDMGDRPSLAYSIDRIDHTGNYEATNCRWATDKQQANNVSSNHLLVWEGKEYTLQLLAESLGIKSNTLCYRLKRGWSLEDAVSGKRELAWKRSYDTRISDEDFEQLLVERYEYKIPLGVLADKYSLEASNLSRVFRKPEVLSFYKLLKGVPDDSTI